MGSMKAATHNEPVSPFSGKIAKKAHQELEEYRGSDAWLQDTFIPYRHGGRLPESSREKVQEIFHLLVDNHGYNVEQKLRDFESLLANLVSTRGRKPIAISLNRNDWVSNRYTLGSYYTIELIHILSNAGFIHMKTGYYTKEESRKTRIWITQKFLDYLDLSHDSVQWEPTELVVLRDENGKLKEYTDTRKTRRIRSILQRVNTVNNDAIILTSRYSLHPYLVAIFIRKFTLYGRLHTRGYRHYQSLPNTARQEITINGDPIVELDYSGLHPRLLYAAEGIQFDDDPYTVVFDNRELRKFLKKSLLSLLNAEGKYVNTRGDNQTWKTAYQLAEAGINQRMGLYRTAADRLREIGIHKASQVIDAFSRAHEPIAHHFCNGKDTGLRVMNKDARIALQVVDYFSEQGIPVLAIHDSFIVQEQYRDELYEIMDKSYREITGGFTCPIK
jgi:hypothetical protein